MACNAHAHIELLPVPAGELLMGSTNTEVETCVEFWGARLMENSYRAVFRDWILKEYPPHRVSLSAFHMARFPVTNGLYREFLHAVQMPQPSSIDACLPDDHPVWGVELEEIEHFLAWLGQRDGQAYRLPTEAEWEWAARGPKRLEYPWGPEFDSHRCNTVESGRGRTTPVGHFPQGASCFGIEDLGGNVEEWTASVYAPYPNGEWIKDDLFALAGAGYPILRGGSFALGGDLARCARRHGPHTSPRFRIRGFRVVGNDREVMPK